MVFYRSRNLFASTQKTKLPQLTHPSLILVAIKICRPCYPCIPSHCSFHHNFLFISSSILCSPPGYSRHIAVWALNTNNQSIKSSPYFSKALKLRVLSGVYFCVQLFVLSWYATSSVVFTCCWLWFDHGYPSFEIPVSLAFFYL